ncbi:MAG TPA: replication protein RepA [Polyangia bacterium]|nr:replication protein RepA [Polyangia bacterium]
MAQDDTILKPTRDQFRASLRADFDGRATEADRRILAASDHGVRDTSRRESRQMDALSDLLVQEPLERERTWVCDALIFCPLPFRPVAEKQVVRRARTGAEEQIEVFYSAVSRASLPYGDDAFLLDLLVSQARKLGSPEVTFDSLKDLLRFVGVSGGGTDYKRLRERVDRISGLHIRIERTKEVAVNIRLVDIQNIEDISNKKTQMLEGEFGQRRLLPYAFRFAPEFYDDLMRHYTVIPLQILRAFAGSPIEYSIARWLYRRIIHTQKPTLVRWADIHAERGGGDSNPRRIRAYARSVVQRLKVIWPGLAEAIDENHKSGLVIQRSAPPLIPDRQRIKA